MSRISRRRFLASGAVAAGALASPLRVREALGASARAADGPYGPLGPPDALGLMLPARFRAREVARCLRPVAGTEYALPIFPDGQAVFATRDGGWILVTNSESISATGAGASAIRFDREARIVDAYRVLGGTNANCAGGPTPWGTWLSCEEFQGGMVWECDPAGALRARPRPAMGLFVHEAAAVDPGGRQVYMTEDEPDGGFYRFTPASYPNLDAGLLEVAVVGSDGQVSWRALPNPAPTPADTPTRSQVPEMTRFSGGEGIWNAGGFLLFTTKGDGRVWSYDLVSARIEVLYDHQATASSLDAVDNITVSAAGEIFVCEDNGNMEVGLITPDRAVSPFLRFSGGAHSVSEVCGAVFDPSGTRLYLTSQGAYTPGGGFRGPGAVYEVSGPFRRPAPGSTPPIVYGPPAGERAGGGPLGTPKPRLRVTAPRRLRRLGLLRRGISVTLSSRARLEATVSIDSADLLSRPGRGGSSRRPKPVLLGREEVELPVEREITVRLRPSGRGRRLLARRRRPLDARIMVSARDLAGNRIAVARMVRVSR